MKLPAATTAAAAARRGGGRSFVRPFGLEPSWLNSVSEPSHWIRTCLGLGLGPSGLNKITIGRSFVRFFGPKHSWLWLWLSLGLEAIELGLSFGLERGLNLRLGACRSFVRWFVLQAVCHSAHHSLARPPGRRPLTCFRASWEETKRQRLTTTAAHRLRRLKRSLCCHRNMIICGGKLVPGGSSAAASSSSLAASFARLLVSSRLWQWRRRLSRRLRRPQLTVVVGTTGSARPGSATIVQVLLIGRCHQRDEESRQDWRARSCSSLVKS